MSIEIQMQNSSARTPARARQKSNSRGAQRVAAHRIPKCCTNSLGTHLRSAPQIRFGEMNRGPSEPPSITPLLQFSLSLSLLPDCLVTLLLFSSQILTLPLVMRLSGSSTTPRLFLCLWKSTGPNALVNVSAMFSRVPTKRGVTSPAATASLVK